MPVRRWGGLLALALLAAALNILPRIFLPPGADVLVHYSLIECFSRQLWGGHLYPRWCIEANAGLGGSDFLFYFPLPYYVTALFYPLKSLIGVNGAYLCGLFVASAAAFVTCTLWLSDVAGRKIALAAAFLLLWLPYRSELLYFRSAYPEALEIAVLPLLLMWLRCAASGRAAGWPALSAIVALMLFTHVPTSLIALGAGSLYLLLLAPQPRVLLKWFVGLALGFAVAAIYAVPAEFFLSALNPEALKITSHVWSSGFLTLANFHGQLTAAVADSISLLALMALAGLVMALRRKIGDVFTQQETTAWCVIAALSLFMLFPVSAPLWTLIRAVASVAATPWRVQVVLMFTLIYLFAVYARWLITPKEMKFATGNYALVTGFLVLLALFTVTMPTGEEALQEGEKVHLMGIARYNQTRWTDVAHGRPAAILAESNHPGPRVEIIKGKGTAEAMQWNDSGIVIEAKLKEKSVIRLHQFYFPLWHARVDGETAALMPQEKTGRILINIPAGSHLIFVYTSLSETMPLLYQLAQMTSLISLLIVVLGFLIQQYFDKRPSAC